MDSAPRLRAAGCSGCSCVGPGCALRAPGTQRSRAAVAPVGCFRDCFLYFINKAAPNVNSCGSVTAAVFGARLQPSTRIAREARCGALGRARLVLPLREWPGAYPGDPGRVRCFPPVSLLPGAAGTDPTCKCSLPQLGPPDSPAAPRGRDPGHVNGPKWVGSGFVPGICSGWALMCPGPRGPQPR